ncbi:PEPxxWA-CTERM sorting domain-containing protein [Sphingomonas sp. SM33]|uniref:PEPxxWA-CTERM sorting domain-containing protein n=1 Tax=Sphingomonas telluris TaxID=2907998 RepID=A0ABS9VI97_9SPHN|nr:PEPxxWA-CTERM sorting domain-containing protein [Sphingomonas telluris]MCH8614698.1 PEPxxWA-CTERM sorting domain-containing protein [Sphingomonas telluris]
MTGWGPQYKGSNSRSSSGRARRARRKAIKRQQRIALGAVGAFAFLAAAPLTIAAYLGTDPLVAGLDNAKSFLAMMSERSPGGRTSAELVTKHKRAAAAPTEHALGKIHSPAPPPFASPIAAVPPSIAELPPFETALANSPPLFMAPPPPGGGGGVIVPPAAPPGGGGGGCCGGTDTPKPPPPPPPAVPEPGTWATMLLGFGMVGLLMRRRCPTRTHSWA